MNQSKPFDPKEARKADATVPDSPPSVEVIGIRFAGNPTLYYALSEGISCQPGDEIILDRGGRLAYATVVLENHLRAEASKVSLGKNFKELEMKLIRIATPEDLEQVAENTQKEQEALVICREKVAEHGLGMKLIQAEYAFDRSKILFYFTADGRVDFRLLVKDLAGIFRTRIELRQVGVRDEAKMLGGIGVCGQSFCCKTFLHDFQPVSIKMAKEQGLSLSPTKISGTCGRLMCCLQYEQANYDQLMQETPRVGAFVSTPEGPGCVTERNVLAGTVYVALEDQPEGGSKKFSVTEISLCKKKPPIKSTASKSGTMISKSSEGAKPVVAPPKTNASKQTVPPKKANTPKQAVPPKKADAPKQAVPPKKADAPQQAVPPKKTNATKPAVSPKKTNATKPAVSPKKSDTPKRSVSTKKAVPPNQDNAKRP